MTKSPRKVLLVGATVLAMAQSVIRGGDVPICIDLFGDTDLRAIAETHVLSTREYPEGFIEAAKAFPGIPRVYSGGLENHPHVIAGLAETGPVWGCDAETLKRVRDPLRLAELAESRHVQPPAVSSDPQRVPTDGSWLCKPKRGSAGRGIHPWNGGRLADDAYLQAHVDGASHSVAFIGGARRARLIGVSRQLVGCNWCNAPPFAYCGSIGPVPLDEATTSALQRLGDRIVQSFGVRGWFGVDFLWVEGVVRPVEINPRYTASMEVYERADGRSLYLLHRLAFSDASTPSRFPAEARVSGKAIVYATRKCRMKSAQTGRGTGRCGDVEYADVPDPSTIIDAGEPITSVVVSSYGVAGMEDMLQAAVAAFRFEWIEPAD